jgi:hypothetical protein
MKPRVYVETSVVSYLTARLSRDVVILGNQVVTRDWWRDAEERFELVVSALVLEEAGDGDPQVSRDRLAALEPLTVLDATDESIALADALIQAHAVPASAVQDAAHIAIAVVNGVEYLSTWNFRHIANPFAASKIEEACRAAGYEPAKICTPRQLMEARHEEL